MLPFIKLLHDFFDDNQVLTSLSNADIWMLPVHNVKQIITLKCEHHCTSVVPSIWDFSVTAVLIPDFIALLKTWVEIFALMRSVFEG